MPQGILNRPPHILALETGQDELTGTLRMVLQAHAYPAPCAGGCGYNVCTSQYKASYSVVTNDPASCIFPQQLLPAAAFTPALLFVPLHYKQLPASGS